jgi:ferritin-like metal-binding protein YciE
MSLENLQDLLIEQVQDMYYAEKQLTSALPKMADAAGTPELQQAFTDHAIETEGHVSRLEQVFEALGVEAKGKRCPAMDGLIEECSEMMEEAGEESILDAGLIASAQRVEHYEIAAYGTMKTLADHLGREDIMNLLDATLQEEHAADTLLTGVAMGELLPVAPITGEDGGDAVMRDRRRRPSVR